MIDASVMKLPTAPIIGKSDPSDRIAYKDAKLIISAKSFVLDCNLRGLFFKGMFWNRFIRLVSNKGLAGMCGKRHESNDR